MEEVLGKVGVTVIDSNLKGVLPLLDLSEKGLGPRASAIQPEPDLNEPAQETDSNFNYEQGGEKP
jgi:hypothetical protein